MPRFTWEWGLQHDFLLDSVKAFLQAGNAVKMFELRFEQSGETAPGPDMARMTAAQLDEYSTLLSEEIAATDNLTSRLYLYDGEAQAILHGARSEEEMLRQVKEAGRN